MLNLIYIYIYTYIYIYIYYESNIDAAGNDFLNKSFKVINEIAPSKDVGIEKKNKKKTRLI